MYRRIFLFALIILTMLLLSGCLPGDGAYTSEHPAGFLSGIWHGWMAPISLVWGLFFDPNVRVYEPNNVGWWYDFAFYVAIIGGFGGFALSRKKH